MTQPPNEPESTPAQDPDPTPATAGEDPGRPPRPPAWSYVLTPLAVLIGAAAVVVAVILTDDDPQPAAEPIGPVLEELSAAVADLSAAAAELSAAAGELADLSAAAAELSAAAGELADAAAARPAVPDTLTLRDALDGYAAALALDAARFGECLADPASYEAVGEQFQLGLDLGVNGTPTFFVNDKLISGALPASVFTEVIAAELAGSPVSIDAYSAEVQALAAREPPAFAILGEAPAFSGAPIKGDPGARVVIVEFSDFQCPFCQRWYEETLPELRPLFGEAVALAFLHFPIVNLHPNAPAVHVAAHCAGEQGKFWEMHDLLFERQDEWAALPNPD